MADPTYYNSSLTAEQIEKALLIAKKIGELDGHIKSAGTGQASGITADEGGGDSGVFLAYFSYTGHLNSSYSEVLTAYNAGKLIIMLNSIAGTGLLASKTTNSFVFTSVRETGDIVYISTLTSGGWSSNYVTLQNTSQIVDSVGAGSDHQHYPTAKAVYEAILAGGGGVAVYDYLIPSYNTLKTAFNDGKLLVIQRGVYENQKYYIYTKHISKTVSSSTKEGMLFVYTDVNAATGAVQFGTVQVYEDNAWSYSDGTPQSQVVDLYTYGASGKYAEIQASINAGHVVGITKGGKVYLHSSTLTVVSPSSTTYDYSFVCIDVYTKKMESIKLTSAGAWSFDNLAEIEMVGNRVTAVDENSDNSHYPTAKAVYDAIGEFGNTDIYAYGDVTAYDAIKASVDAGRNVLVMKDGKTYQRSSVYGSASIGYYYYFVCVDIVTKKMESIMLSPSGVWSFSTANEFELTANRVTSIGSTSTDAQYPSAKAVYDSMPLVLTYGSSTYTYAQLATYARAGRQIWVQNTNYEMYYFRGFYVTGTVNVMIFVSMDILNYGIKYVQLKEDGTWGLYTLSQRVTSISSVSTDAQFPSAKAVYSAILQATLTFEYNDATGVKPLYIQINQAYTNKQNVQIYIVKSGSSGNYNYAVGHFMGRHAETSGGTTTAYFVFVAYEMDVGKFVRYTVTSTDQWTRTEL